MTNAVQPDATSSPVRVGILLSGRGSNLEALLRHADEGTFARAQFACALSDIPTAPGLSAAARAGLPAAALEPSTFPSRVTYETEIVRRFDELGIEWLCLAGYMRIVGKTLLARYPSRILNIHPSLLPAFPGLHAQQQALDHGVRVAGCTVHLVDSGMDTGPIIAQAAVPVLDNDTEETLSARILKQEHKLYAEGLKRITEQPWEVQGRRLIFLPTTSPSIKGTPPS